MGAVMGMPRTGVWSGWAFLYALSIVYVSTVLGPLGFHYVPLSLDRAWVSFLSTSYFENGADQRPDWIANLLMLLPLGFLLCGAFQSRRGDRVGLLAPVLAMAVGLTFVLAVKFAQLWFPPRTVSLNYIIAQSAGCVAGVGLFLISHGHFSGFAKRWFGDRGGALIILLSFYCMALVLFLLLPFDFALGASELHARMQAVPHLLIALPGGSRSIAIRVAVIVFDTVAMVPLGMLLYATNSWRSLRWVVFVGSIINAGLIFVMVFILSAAPLLISIVYRTAGVAMGGWLMKQIGAQDMTRWRRRLSHAVPAAAGVYVLLVLFVSGVSNLQFRPLAYTETILDHRGLLPFWHFYIVSKAHAAESFVVHVVTFAPVGMLIWLRYGEGRERPMLAAMLALVFSALMELARWLKQGLQPDFTDPIIAAFSAAIMVQLMPWIWRAVDSEARLLARLGSRRRI
jgi:VanZ like family